MYGVSVVMGIYNVGFFAAVQGNLYEANGQATACLLRDLVRVWELVGMHGQQYCRTAGSVRGEQPGHHAPAQRHGQVLIRFYWVVRDFNMGLFAAVSRGERPGHGVPAWGPGEGWGKRVSVTM